MTMVKEIREITKDEYESAKEMQITDLQKFACNKAIEFGYHPAGYGCYDPKVFTKAEQYYLQWTRQSSCD